MKNKGKSREQLSKNLKDLRKKLSEHKKAEEKLKKAEKALRESEERYRILVDSTEDSIYQVNRNSRYLFMNKKHLQRLGISREALKTVTYAKFHSSRETKIFKQKISYAFKTGTSEQYEYKSERDSRFFLQTLSPVKNKDGKVTAVTIISKDITNRRLVQEALKESEERFKALFDQASDSIFLLEPTPKGLIIVDMNDAACKIHGYSYEELIGEPIAMLDDMEAGKQIGERTNLLMKGETLTFEAKHVRKDGSEFPVEISAQLIEIADEPYVLGIDRDISERKKMEEELRALSLTDELTGLNNRRACLTLGEQLLKIANRQMRGMFVLYADLDNLKGINDKLGHEEGDRALIDIAKVFKRNYRESDVVARIGGDEFVVIPVGTAGENEATIMKRLFLGIDRYLLTNKRKYRLSLSCGVAYYDPRRPCSIEKLLNRADKLMYKQKMLKKKKQNV